MIDKKFYTKINNKHQKEKNNVMKSYQDFIKYYLQKFELENYTIKFDKFDFKIRFEDLDFNKKQKYHLFVSVMYPNKSTEFDDNFSYKIEPSYVDLINLYIHKDNILVDTNDIDKSVVVIKKYDIKIENFVNILSKEVVAKFMSDYITVYNLQCDDYCDYYLEKEYGCDRNDFKKKLLDNSFYKGWIAFDYLHSHLFKTFNGCLFRLNGNKCESKRYINNRSTHGSYYWHKITIDEEITIFDFNDMFNIEYFDEKNPYQSNLLIHRQHFLDKLKYPEKIFSNDKGIALDFMYIFNHENIHQFFEETRLLFLETVKYGNILEIESLKIFVNKLNNVIHIENVDDCKLLSEHAIYNILQYHSTLYISFETYFNLFEFLAKKYLK